MSRSPLSRKLRFKILRRDGFACVYCGMRPPEAALEVDHIYPVSKGGTNQPFNLITSCHVCNMGKRASVLSEMEAFALTQDAAARLLQTKPIHISDAQEKRLDEVMSVLRKKFDCRAQAVMQEVIIFCIKGGSTWAQEIKWAGDVEDIHTWWAEQYRYLAQTTLNKPMEDADK